jgi:hypothetical protein
MNQPTNFKYVILSVRNLILPAIAGPSFLLIALTLVCFDFLPTAEAVSPAPDGGYAGANTAEGTNALLKLDTTKGFSNTATGFQALFNNNSGSDNTATGVDALFNNSTGNHNTALGFEALLNNTVSDNTAIGFSALANNTSGTENTATGSNALLHNTTGFSNTAEGESALFSNSTGGDNTANGSAALLSNTSGNDNTATGVDTLAHNTTGNDNTATGSTALARNIIGSNNTALGFEALLNNTVSDNTAIGFSALANIATGNSNVAVGSNAGLNLTTGNNNIVIGANVPAVAGEANTIRIGKSGTQQKTFIAGISGKTVANGVGVIIGPSGQLGTVVSSARFKQQIKAMGNTSESILALNPVTFRYNEGLDPDHLPQFGLVAEEVEKVNPDLVVRDEEGKLMTVRYEAVNAMLLNEFLKAHRKLEEQQTTIERQEKQIAAQEAKAAHQQKQIEALTAGLQKVTARVEANQTARRVVSDN